uniref:Uncharacterized protein n=1 Tax=uncultured Desulfobacterium sp. TaxID=201089 RepID=E1YB89_9BACT|nr:unknown protein [uncultured Desulfobacterium sp.]
MLIVLSARPVAFDTALILLAIIFTVNLSAGQSRQSSAGSNGRKRNAESRRYDLLQKKGRFSF